MFRLGNNYADPWVTKQLHDCARATDSLLDIIYLRCSSALLTSLKPAEIHPPIARSSSALALGGLLGRNK